MAVFKYKAINKISGMYEDTVEANDRFAVYQLAKDKGDTVVHVKELKSKTLHFFSRTTGFFGKIKAHDKVIFARNLGAMIQAGLPVTLALSVMERQVKNKKLKRVLLNIKDDISKGRSLSDSLRSMPGTFSSLFISMVKAGEESGKLSDALKVIGLQMEKSYVLARKIKGALLYPAVIVVIMIIIGVLMLVYMVPTLTATFEGLGVELPASTRAIIAVSDFLRTQYVLTIVTVSGLIAATFLFSRSRRGKRVLSLMLIHLPIIGYMVKEINAARTARTLSSLLSSGVDIVVAIEVTGGVVQNVFFKEVLNKAQHNVEKGDLISSVFIENSHLYPIFLGEMVSVGEETGQLSAMLAEVANFYEDEVDQKTKNISTIIEPILMVLMGIVVGFFAISMLAPTYSLVEAI